MADRRRVIRISCIAIVFLVLLPPPQLVSAGNKYPRMTLTPRTPQQMRKFLKNQASATTPGMYLCSYQVGTPPQTVSGALDLSIDFLWTTQCGSSSSTMAVVPCSSDACQNEFAQKCPADDVAEPRCRYKVIYNDGEANTTGYLATESFTFGDTRVDDVAFGCAAQDSVDDLGSVIGLGRGPLSLVSQLDAGRFSYYLAPDGGGGDDSFILFGDDAMPQTKSVVTTRLLASDDEDYQPYSYLVGLSGIHVDGRDIGIPRGTFDLRNGSGGVVLNIAFPVTFLEGTAYRLLRQALVTRIGLPTVDGTDLLGLDVCYEAQSLAATAKTIPAVALVFDDGDAVMDLEVGNYFYMDATSGLHCLTILPSPEGQVSALGSLIQAGTHMIYDFNASTLAFESLQQTSSSSSSSSDQGMPGGHRLSSAPPPHVSLPMLFAHFLWSLWVAVYMVL